MFESSNRENFFINKLRNAYKKISKQLNISRSVDQFTQKRFKRCVLHIGTEKTGTSSIQRFLSKNRQAFIRDGVLYPATAGEYGGSQWEFILCAHNAPWGTDVGKILGVESIDDRDRYIQSLRKKLIREFSASPKTDVLIISSEHMHSHLVNKESIEQLKDFLSEWVEDFEVLMYMRRQDQVEVSLFSTWVKSGNPDPTVFKGQSNGTIPYYYNYELIYDNWSAVFGRSSVKVRLFSSSEWLNGSLMYDFCNASRISVNNKKMLNSENVSLSQEGVDFLREINRQLPGSFSGKKNDDRDHLTQVVSKLCRGKNYPVCRKDAVEFYHLFKESNERLKSKAFPDRTEALFPEDFSDYPEVLEPLEHRYEDAVEMAIRIWRELK